MVLRAQKEPQDPGPVLLAEQATHACPCPYMRYQAEVFPSLPFSLRWTQGTRTSCKYWEAHHFFLIPPPGATPCWKWGRGSTG